MKIAIRAGHSLDIRGAVGLVDEVTEDRKITVKVIEYLRLAGHTVLDVTPTYSGTSGKDLSIPVSKANSWGADYFVSIHLNASNGAGHGAETLYKSSGGQPYAERIVNKLAALGFANRGAKADTRGLYEFNRANMVNNIIEPFFVDNAADVALYNQVGVNAIALAIAEGITGTSIQDLSKNGWYLDRGSWYYYSNGSMAMDTWAKDNSGRWFYLGTDGAMVTNGWAKDSSERWFYLAADGAMVINDWAQDSHGWCYLGTDGAWDGITHENKEK